MKFKRLWQYKQHHFTKTIAIFEIDLMPMKYTLNVLCFVLSSLSNIEMKAQSASSLEWNIPSWELGAGAVLKHHEDFTAGRIMFGTRNIMIKNRFGLYYILEYKGNIQFLEDNSKYYFRDLLGLNYSINERFSVNAGLGIFRKGLISSGAERGGEYFYKNIQFGRLRKEVGISYRNPKKPWSFNLAYSSWVGPTITGSYIFPMEKSGSGLESAENRKLFPVKQPKANNTDGLNPSNEIKPQDTANANKTIGVVPKQIDTVVTNIPAKKEATKPTSDSSSGLVAPVLPTTENKTKVESEPKNTVPVVTNTLEKKEATNPTSDSSSGLVAPVLPTTENKTKVVPEPNNIIPVATIPKKKETTRPATTINNVTKVISPIRSNPEKTSSQMEQKPKYKELHTIVYFPFDMDTLTQTSIDTLQNFVNRIGGSKINRIMIIGTADNSGSDQYNLRLSEFRANRVKQFLISHGIDPKLIKINAVGETISTGITEEERTLNRYVEVIISID